MADKKKKVVPVGKPERASGQRKVAVPAGAGKTATSATGGRRTAPPSVGKGKGKKLGQAGSLGVARSYAGGVPIGGAGGESQGGYGGDTAVDINQPQPTPTPARIAAIYAPESATQFERIGVSPAPSGPRYNPVSSPSQIIDSVIAPAASAVGPSGSPQVNASTGFVTGARTPTATVAPVVAARPSTGGVSAGGGFGTPSPSVNASTGFVVPRTTTPAPAPRPTVAPSSGGASAGGGFGTTAPKPAAKPAAKKPLEY